MLRLTNRKEQCREQIHDEARGKHRIETIHHSAVTRQPGRHVFYAQVAFDERFGEVTEDGGEQNDPSAEQSPVPVVFENENH